MGQGNKKGLTAKARLFAAEYLKDKNQTQAAIRAGYREKHADRIASRLMKNPRIAALVGAKVEAQIKRVENDADDIIRELKRLGYSDIRGIYKDDGTIHHPKDWPLELAHAVASFEVEELFEGHGAHRTGIGDKKKVKFWPKDRALELLGKNKKLYTDRREVGIDESLASILAQSWGDGKGSAE